MEWDTRNFRVALNNISALVNSRDAVITHILNKKIPLNEATPLTEVPEGDYWVHQCWGCMNYVPMEVENTGRWMTAPESSFFAEFVEYPDGAVRLTMFQSRPTLYG